MWRWFIRGSLLSLIMVGPLTSVVADSRRLSVVGNQIMFGDAPVQLHGIAVGDAVLIREDEQRPLADYRIIAQEWNANIVRIGIHPSVWIQRDRSRTLARLAREVRAARSNGMFVLIDWHVIGWPDGYFPKTYDEKSLYDSRMELARSYWDAVAQRFAHDGGVMFELWNEPMGSDRDWERGPQWKKLKPFWEELQGIVRRHGDNIVLVSGNEWAYNLGTIETDPLTGPNVAYAWHIYAGNDDNKPERWLQRIERVRTFAPIVVSEWGFEANSPHHYRGTESELGIPFTKFIREQKLHSIAWCYHPEWGPPLIKDDWLTPTLFGSFVKRFLKVHTTVGYRYREQPSAANARTQ